MYIEVFMRPLEGVFQQPAQNNHDWQKKNRESRFRLDIENEFFTRHGAGNADLHKVFAICVIQEFVTVIHFSREQANFAIAAPAIFAGIHHIDVVFPQYFEDGFICRYRQGFTAHF